MLKAISRKLSDLKLSRSDKTINKYLLQFLLEIRINEKAKSEERFEIHNFIEGTTWG